MPKTIFQKRIFALITVIFTVPCFVFYCLSLENGGILNVDIKFALAIIPIELILAFLSATYIVSPFATKLALKAVNPKEQSQVIVTTAIVCATVCLMCLLMTFLATILYKGIFPGLIFHEAGFKITDFLIYFIPNFLQAFVQNLPFAFFSQLFFIQPLTRKTFALLFNE